MCIYHTYQWLRQVYPACRIRLQPHLRSVSYTHQMCIRDSIWHGSNVTYIVQSSNRQSPVFLLALRIAAVSYTHLDVYKRQRHCLESEDSMELDALPILPKK